MVEQVKISITLQDDTLVIMSFITNDRNGYVKEPTDENINLEILKSNFGVVKSWRRIQDSDLILDRTFRNAWRDINGKHEVDMPHAREIHKDHLRMLRAEKLIQLDGEYMRADEENNAVKKNEIRLKKQKLRDITIDPRIESARTPEELKNACIEDIK